MLIKFGRPCAGLVALIFLLSQSPVARSYQNPSRPFTANITAVATGFPCGTYTATGTATHLGAITESGSYCVVEVLGPGLVHLAGEGTQTAANGSTFSFTLDEVVNLNVNPLASAGTFTITGGTGQFAGATGGGTFAATGTAEGQTFNLSIEYTGTITY